MKVNEIKELRTKTIPELLALVKETKDALFTIKMDIMQSKEKNVKQVGMKKDDIARILTIINEKEREEKNGKSA